MSKKPDFLYDTIIRSSWHKIARMYNQKAAEHHVTPSIGFILMNIDKDGTPSTSLGPKMGMEPTSLSRTLKTMEEKSLIYRKEDEFDKRKVLIFLTQQGVEGRKIVKQFILEFNEKVVEKIAKTKLNIFLEVMSQLDEIVDENLNNHQKK
ncbi:MAG: MarR family transcriptional regulator [Bacteroidia bacterium]|nr:MAG: MarR family transcriptional regulator [Bacteroidia bacterium]